MLKMHQTTDNRQVKTSKKRFYNQLISQVKSKSTLLLLSRFINHNSYSINKIQLITCQSTQNKHKEQLLIKNYLM